MLGEAAYAWGKIRGTAHCSLCDITHSPVRRKKAWDQMAARMDATIELRHLNELTSEQEAAVEQAGAPVVLLAGTTGDAADTGTGSDTATGHTVLLDRAELDELGGDVARFEEALRQRLADHDLA
ncbi:hypothetical protein [Serinicoccus kebangsaanensis]|uniref:hypothetical protein n=1 Tax=Serinicoccus kebangsaanensis TaxID=2602069 RepID=UPI00124E1145|nr:hypothetical protein [Serinicoccus kebangsaanensis]